MKPRKELLKDIVSVSASLPSTVNSLGKLRTYDFEWTKYWDKKKAINKTQAKASKARKTRKRLKNAKRK